MRRRGHWVTVSGSAFKCSCDTHCSDDPHPPRAGRKLPAFSQTPILPFSLRAHSQITRQRGSSSGLHSRSALCPLQSWGAVGGDVDKTGSLAGTPLGKPNCSSPNLLRDPLQARPALLGQSPKPAPSRVRSHQCSLGLNEHDSMLAANPENCCFISNIQGRSRK